MSVSPAFCFYLSALFALGAVALSSPKIVAAALLAATVGMQGLGQ